MTLITIHNKKLLLSLLYHINTDTVQIILQLTFIGDKKTYLKIVGVRGTVLNSQTVKHSMLPYSWKMLSTIIPCFYSFHS